MRKQPAPFPHPAPTLAADAGGKSKFATTVLLATTGEWSNRCNLVGANFSPVYTMLDRMAAQN